MFKLNMLLSIFCLSIFSLKAIEPISQIGVSSGWRYDTVTTSADSNANGAHHVPLVPLTDDRIKGKSLNIWEIGVNGNFAFPQVLNDCEHWWLNGFYLNGYAYWGRIFDGSFSAVNRDLTVNPPRIDFTQSGKIKSGRTHNYQIELGWLYSYCGFCNDFGIAPIVGYSWDELSYVATHVSQNPSDCFGCDFGFPVILQDLEYTTRWKGPFLGFNMVYDLCQWRFNFGYEYHWAQWRASYTLQFPDNLTGQCSGFSDARKANDAHGHAVYLNIAWDFCNRWAFVLGGKYRIFEAKHGSLLPANGDFEDLGCNRTEVDVKKARWESWEVTFDVAYRF